MIAANGVTARFLSSKGFPSIRRVVRTPRRWERIVEIAAEHGGKLPDDPDSKALDDFLVATQIGTTNEITAHELFGEEFVQSYGDFGAAIEALMNDDVDAVVVDRPAAEGYIETQGNLMTLDESLAGIEGLAFAFPPGSDLVEPINAAMWALQYSGVWDEIFAKWFEN